MKWRTRVLNTACMMSGCVSLDAKDRPVPDKAKFDLKFKTEERRLNALQYANRTLRVAGYWPMQGAVTDDEDGDEILAPIPETKAKVVKAAVKLKAVAKATPKPRRPAKAPEQPAA